MKDRYYNGFCYNTLDSVIVFSLNFQTAQPLGLQTTLRKMKVRVVYKLENFSSKYYMMSNQRKIIYYISKGKLVVGERRNICKHNGKMRAVLLMEN